MNESKPRSERPQRSAESYPRIEFTMFNSAQAVFVMAQQTRDVALDTRDSLRRIEDLLEAFAQEFAGHKLADALIAGLGPALAEAIAKGEVA